jgi:hypothetical protein
MKKVVLVIGIIIVLVGFVMGGMVLHAYAAGPTLKALGSSAPGTVTITGSNWTNALAVALYMDVPGNPPFLTGDDKYKVAVATPGSNGVFVTTFTVGPTLLGNHTITAVQGGNNAEATFTITNTSQMDSRPLDEIQKMIPAVTGDSGSLTYPLSVHGVVSTTVYTTVRHVSYTIDVAGLGSGDTVNLFIQFKNPTVHNFQTIKADGVYTYEFDAERWEISLDFSYTSTPLVLNWVETTIAPALTQPGGVN